MPFQNPPTRPFYITSSPTLDYWSDGEDYLRGPQPTSDGCQFITFYHACGCRSYRDSVYLCSHGACQHTTSTVLLGELPFACGLYPGRSPACSIEDPAKKEFVREVDTADRLEKLLILPNCTQADIDALIPPFHHEKWQQEVYNHYQLRLYQRSVDIPPSPPPLSPRRDANGNGAGSEEIVNALLLKYDETKRPTMADYEHRENLLERYIEEQHQLSYRQTADKAMGQIPDIKYGPPLVGDTTSSAAYYGNNVWDDAPYYNDTAADNIIFDFDEGTKDPLYHPEVSAANPITTFEEDAESNTHFEKESRADYYDHVVPRNMEVPRAPKYSEDGCGTADEMTDGFIDFLAEEEKLQGGSPMVRKLWSFITGY
ncbi:hypothetical protein F5Y11DRAFT_352823 [Daldinia sp. FL1419]|nr:hypothetical protein F5Y11DRAFT_352823 [Daldinia sp. FL1419]